MSVLGDVTFWALYPPGLVAFVWCVFPRVRIRGEYASDWAWSAGIMSVVFSFGQDWAAVAGCAASLVVALIVAWWNRRRRDRAGQLLGDKSRQLLAALVRRMRDVTTPRRILRPVPTPS